MSENDIVRFYKNLGLKVEPVAPNYNPDTFGKSLMANANCKLGVSYSASTEYALDAGSDKNRKDFE